MRTILQIALLGLIIGGLAHSDLVDEVLRLRPSSLPSKGTSGEFRVDKDTGKLKQWDHEKEEWSEISGSGGSGGSAGINLLTNGDFRNGATGWTASGTSTLTVDSTGAVPVATWTPTDDGDTLDCEVVEVGDALAGNACQATIKYQHSDSTVGAYIFQVLNDSGDPISAREMPAVTKMEFLNPIGFRCDADASKKHSCRIVSDGPPTSPIRITQAYVGEETRVSKASSFPVGAVFEAPSGVCPVGSLPLSGPDFQATYNIVDYPELFAELGTMYGGDGITTFGVEDRRGYFMRGWDGGAEIDPDAATRTDRGDGTMGDEVGTIQDDAFQGHWHGSYGNPFQAPAGTGARYVAHTGTLRVDGQVNDPVSDGVNGTPRISNETRPKNRNALYCIQAKSTGPESVTTSISSQFGSVKYEGKSGCSWTTTNNEYADFDPDLDCNDPIAKGSAIAPSTKVPHGVFKNISQGTWKAVVRSRLQVTPNIHRTLCAFRLTDGINHGGERAFSCMPGDNCYYNDFSDIFEYDADQEEVTIKIQSRRTSGDGLCSVYAASAANAFEISLEPVSMEKKISAVLEGFPKFIGRALVQDGDTNCTEATCVISYQNGDWLTSTTRDGTGSYTLNFKPGVFSVPPVCNITANSFVIVKGSTATPSERAFNTYNAAMSLADARAFNIICMEPN